MPLSDRDYMRQPPPPPRRRPVMRQVRDSGFALNPVLVIIIINLVFYFTTLVNSDIRFELGLIPQIFLERPWTIISAMFIHANFWHLFGNMITLYFFGSFLNRLIGQNWFLLVYLVGGILGNAVYLGLGEPVSIAYGASGAVYAVAGTLVVLMPRLRVAIWGVFPMPLWVVVLVFFVLFSFVPGVAWPAHLGGLATGLLAGLYLKKRIRFIF